MNGRVRSPDITARLLSRPSPHSHPTVHHPPPIPSSVSGLPLAFPKAHHPATVYFIQPLFLILIRPYSAPHASQMWPTMRNIVVFRVTRRMHLISAVQEAREYTVKI